MVCSKSINKVIIVIKLKCDYSMTLLNLVYVHIGGELPECFMDNIYQTLLMNYSQLKIYILLDDNLIDKVKDDIGLLNTIYFNDDIPLELHFVFVKNSLLKSHLDSNISYKKYIESVEKFQLSGFRNGFWITTTTRFFYIWALMELFNIKRVFHIENDVILYDSLSNIYSNLLNNVRGNIDKMIMVRDSEHRVIPSIMYIPDNHNIAQLVDYISVTLQGSDVFLNDMMLLASYPDYYEFNICTSFLIIYIVYRNRNIFNINIQLLNNNKELEYTNKDLEHENKEIKSLFIYIRDNNKELENKQHTDDKNSIYTNIMDA